MHRFKMWLKTLNINVEITPSNLIHDTVWFHENTSNGSRYGYAYWEIKLEFIDSDVSLYNVITRMSIVRISIWESYKQRTLYFIIKITFMTQFTQRGVSARFHSAQCNDQIP